MKSLSSYTTDAQTKLFNEKGAFFAFSHEQLNSSKKEGVDYVNMGGGLIAPKEHAKALNKGMSSIYKQGISLDLSENGKAAIIKRELFNYECFYVSDISDCVEALVDYDISKDEILAVFNKLAPTVDM